jgi:anaerobic magnesium-protoporphyrin IX monomethyl ester cyclase
MNIGLIFPNKDRRYKTVHIGLASLAAYAREQHPDLQFYLLDTRVATKKETRQFFSRHYDLIGMTVFSPVYFEVKDLFNKIREKDAKIPICLGGPYVTTIREEIFSETPADFAVYGEGEITFSELISYLKGKTELKDIDGLIYRNGSGNVIVNPPRKKIGDLDSLPLPAYDIFPMDRYPLHRMVTSRGCIFACAWCNSSSIWGPSYREMSAERIVAELEHLIRNYGKKIFVFGDNTFNADLRRVEDFCDLLTWKKLDILWSVSLRADILTREIAMKMKKAGCYNVSIGIESANNDILAKMCKGTTIEKVTEGIKILKDAGIEIMSQYVIGSPEETLDTIKESIAYAKQSGCDYTNFYSVLPFKGTRQWDYVLEHGTLVTDKIHEFHSINPRVVFETPEFSFEDRIEAIRLVKKEGFYSNKDTKNWWFDFAKDIGMKIQHLLPKETGERVYLILKSIYRLKMVKKHNI